MMTIVYILIYSFAVLGCIVFIEEIINICKYKKSQSKIVLIIEKDDNVEQLMRDTLKFINSKYTFDCVYIFLQNAENEQKAIVQKFLEQNHILKIVGYEELINILTENRYN